MNMNEIDIYEKTSASKTSKRKTESLNRPRGPLDELFGRLLRFMMFVLSGWSVTRLKGRKNGFVFARAVHLEARGSV